MYLTIAIIQRETAQHVHIFFVPCRSVCRASNADANHDAMLINGAQSCSASRACVILAHAQALGLMDAVSLNSAACLQGHDLTCHTTMSMS